MNRNLIYKIYALIHKMAKTFLRKRNLVKKFRMISIYSNDFDRVNVVKIDSAFINDFKVEKNTTIKKENVFPFENIVEPGSCLNFTDSFRKKKINLKFELGINKEQAVNSWNSFIDTSIIPCGYRNSGLHYAGYISSGINEWCLPSWIWTNAALVRLYCSIGDINKAISLADLLLIQQQESGGWIVRFDYDENGAVPILAPNDSAYIANNAFIEIYKITKDEKYLNVAKRCANWIMDTARDDGMINTGYNIKRKRWITEYHIVDEGFTAGLFANLFEITNNNKYKLFLERFIKKYIESFYDKSKKGFATSLDKNNKRIGGMFGRGQAWALEGIIPAYMVLQTNDLRETIQNTINSLLRYQLKNGGWSYNLTRPLMGEDNKAVAIIAKNILEWNKIYTNEEYVLSAKNALDWCLNHTSTNGISKGGIFSFNTEGAIVHNHYTSTAFVYSSAYAIELYNLLVDLWKK